MHGAVFPTRDLRVHLAHRVPAGDRRMVAGTARRMAGPMMALLGSLTVIAAVAFGGARTPKASNSPSFAPWPPRPRSCGRPVTPPGSARPQRQPHLSRRSHDVPMRATWCRARHRPERLRHSRRAHGGRAYGPKRGTSFHGARAVEPIRETAVTSGCARGYRIGAAAEVAIATQKPACWL